jgi:NAD(P)-dependent dehydrogenase (short-subunit alcohol dehydrogenase family)
VSPYSGKVAVVTGAASGIGRALALGLARRGARLALSDVDEAGLAGTASATGISEVHTQRLDVAERDAWPAYADAVVERFGVVHQIYNNAGVAHSRPVLETELSEYDRVFGINLWGVIYGTKAFLPHVIASGDGHVVNVSSINGFMAQPDMSHYVASKFAVRGFTETLRLEMERDGHPVRVTSVHPGGIRTNIATSALKSARALGMPVTEAEERRERLYNEKLLKMSPDDAARIILDGVEAGKPRVLVGNDAKAIDALVRVLPARYTKAVMAFEKRVG